MSEFHHALADMDELHCSVVCAQSQPSLAVLLRTSDSDQTV